MGSLAHSIIEPHLKDSSFNVPTASYPAASSKPPPSDLSEIKKIAAQVIDDINNIIQSKVYTRLGSVFLTDSGYWKDHLGLTNTQFVTLSGTAQIIGFITQHLTSDGGCAIQRFGLESGKEPQVADLDPEGKIKCIQAFIVFETKHARGRGVMTLLRDLKDRDEWKVYMMFTSLNELKAAPWKEKQTKDLYGVPGDVLETKNWADWREETREFVYETPAVLIIGAGHSGLMIAARLKMLGVEALVVDKSVRVGDSWRTRYHRLVLHDPCWSNSMPYLAYPAFWPVFASKDKIGDFLEFYASTLELNVWNQTQLSQSTWDKKGKKWTVVLERIVNGTRARRTLYPRHLIQATGLNGEPRIPSIPGLQTFLGQTRHSTEFNTGTVQDAGKKIIVVGTGASGHDIADDLYRQGAHVTIIQRSPNFVISLPSVLAMMKTRYDEGKITEDSDLMMASMPATVFNRIGSEATRLFQKRDQHVLDGLTRAGFALDTSNPSLLSLTIHRAGGFYVDAGTSSLIASGAIAVKQARAITRIKPHSIVLDRTSDGEKIEEEIEADEIFFATGYENGRVRTRKILGDEVADKIDPIWGFNEMGEIRGVWRRSGQEGFWVAAGSFWLSRYYSKLLALQIKLLEMGLVEL